MHCESMVESHFIGLEPNKEKLYRLERIRRSDYKSTVVSHHTRVESNEERLHQLEVIRRSGVQK